MAEAMEVYGNPSSIHQEGQAARFIIDEARRHVAALVKARPEEVIFTSGGTEANVMAIKGIMFLPVHDGTTLVTLATDHDCVCNTARALHEAGKPVTEVAMDKNGCTTRDNLLAHLSGPHAKMLVVSAVNNETGVKQPLNDIVDMVKSHNVHLHIDAVQHVGKLPCDFGSNGADSMAIAAHKFGGPKGVGALILRNGTTCNALLTGGAQERYRRAGTENVVGIAGFGAAAQVALAQQQQELENVTTLQADWESFVKHHYPNAIIVGADTARSPYISNIIFPGIDVEQTLIRADMHGVALSHGAACSSGKLTPSHVLTAMGYSKEDAQSALRFSFGYASTAAEITRLKTIFAQIIPR